MNRRTSRGFSLAGLAAGVLLLAAWLLVGPAGYGGSATWVVPHGTSMTPLLDPGDVVVLKPAQTYALGDVIGYRSTELDSTVLHRIVDRDREGFITRGDANSWRDPDRVDADQILGTLWFHLPGGGRVLDLLHTPWAVAALVVVGLLVLGWTGARRRPRGQRRLGDSFSPQPGALAVAVPASTIGQGAMVVAALAAALALTSFAPASTAELVPEQTYAHRAQLSYSAAVPVSGIYDEDRLRTGDPVYVDVTPTVQAQLSLTAAPQLGSVSGTVTPLLRLRASNGWQRNLQLGPASDVTGHHAKITTDVDLAAAHRLVRTAEERSGVTLGGYTLNVLFRTSLRGELDGQPVHDVLSPALSFAADGQQAILTGGSTSGAAVSITEEAGVVDTAEAPARVSLLNWQVDPTLLRVAAAVLGLVAGVLALWWRRRRRTDNTSPAALFGRRLVAATAVDVADRAVVEVTDLGTLDRLATQHDLPVIWQRDHHHACYHVEVAGTVYRHRLGPPHSQDQHVG